ncbi:unnamed protein product, partial [Candidula unifasciata]
LAHVISLGCLCVVICLTKIAILFTRGWFVFTVHIVSLLFIYIIIYFLMSIYFCLTKEEQIRRDDYCLSYTIPNGQFISTRCQNDKRKWKYSKENLIIFDDTGLCMAELNKKAIVMVTCNSSDTSQQWKWPRESIAVS